MKMFASPSRVIARLTFCQSESLSWPVRIRWASTRASEAKQPLGELEVAHLEAEQERRPAQDRTDVREDPEREARLAHRGARAHDREAGRLQAEQDVVEVREARRGPGDVALAPLLDPVDRLVQQLAERADALGVAALGDVEDHLLGRVDDRRDVVGRAVGEVGDLAARADEAPQDRELLDDRRRSASRSPTTACSPGATRAPPGRRPSSMRPGAVELVGDRDGVGGLPGLVEARDRARRSGRAPACRSRRRSSSSVPIEIASVESSIAPSSDSSARRLCGGTLGPSSGRRRRSGRASSTAWTMTHQLSPSLACGAEGAQRRGFAVHRRPVLSTASRRTRADTSSRHEELWPAGRDMMARRARSVALWSERTQPGATTSTVRRRLDVTEQPHHSRSPSPSSFRCSSSSDLGAIDLDARRAESAVGDLGRADGPEELALRARARGDRDAPRLDAPPSGSGAAARSLRVLQVAGAAHRRGLARPPPSDATSAEPLGRRKFRA